MEALKQVRRFCSVMHQYLNKMKKAAGITVVKKTRNAVAVKQVDLVVSSQVYKETAKVVNVQKVVVKQITKEVNTSFIVNSGSNEGKAEPVQVA